jgi:hypothetical protein
MKLVKAKKRGCPSEQPLFFIYPSISLSFYDNAYEAIREIFYSPVRLKIPYITFEYKGYRAIF